MRLGSAPVRVVGVLHACVGQIVAPCQHVAVASRRSARGRSKRRGDSAGNERDPFPPFPVCRPRHSRTFIIFGGQDGSGTGDRPAAGAHHLPRKPGPGESAVKFVASTPSLTASFEENAIGLQIGSQQQNPVRLEFEGTSSTSQLVGVGSTSDPSQSQTAGAAFSSIRYTGLYNGIDMQVDDSGGELQYELFVAPGANIADTMIHADGGAVTVAADGSLMIQTPTGTLHQTAPVSWDVLPDGTKHPLESHFHIDDNGDYGFEVVGHDATLPMVIDPILVPAPTIVAPANGASVTEPFNISWTSVTANPSGVIGYNWEVSTSSTFSTIVYEHSVNSPTTQDVISGLASGTYFWRVQAADGAFDQGTWSTPQSFTITGVNASSPGTPVLAPPQAYTTFHPFEAGTTSWTPVPGAATYVYEVSNGDPNFGWNNLFREDNLTTTTHSFDSGFEATFYVRVYAVSADGIRGVPSNVISYNYAFNNPIGPAPVALAPIGGQTVTLPVTLQWAHVPNPQTFGYDVEVATDPQFKNIEDLEVQESFPFVTIDSLTPGTKYWRVTSEQGASRPPRLTAPACPPSPRRRRPARSRSARRLPRRYRWGSRASPRRRSCPAAPIST